MKFFSKTSALNPEITPFLFDNHDQRSKIGLF